MTQIYTTKFNLNMKKATKEIKKATSYKVSEFLKLVRSW
jgi:hypothetical protein